MELIYLLTVIFVLGLVASIIVEYFEWNHGVCRCGERWITFGRDSRGSLGHSCPKCGKIVWTGWFGEMQFEPQRLRKEMP